MADADDRPIVKEIYIDAPLETVFAYLSDPVKILSWIGTSAELDPRPGGVFRLSPNARDIVSGKFLEVVPNKKIVFTWGWERPGATVPPGSSRVEITLTAQGKGTLVRLVHSGLSGDDRRKHDAGWDHYLARLAIVSAGGMPGPDPLADATITHG